MSWVAKNNNANERAIFLAFAVDIVELERGTETDIVREGNAEN